MTLATSPSPWRQIFRQNFRQWEPLTDYLELSLSQRKEVLTTSHFPLNLPRRLAEKIIKGTLDDPILRQFLPHTLELKSKLGFVKDPNDEQGCRTTPKLLHKYSGRALLVCTSSCAMHCRYCFRQNFEYETEIPTFTNELQAISEDTSIHEVILSGGDPLSLSDRTLSQLMNSLCAIPHVQRIRFHTRFPIGIPERIDEQFLEMIKQIPCQIWFVTHSNHPLELDSDVLSRLKQLQKLGVVILNQTVLLRGVNDSVEVLKSLFERLVNHGIFPYYLHQLDRVQGSAHFEVPENEGQYLIQELAKQLPGYAVPKYVREVSGEPSKTILF